MDTGSLRPAVTAGRRDPIFRGGGEALPVAFSSTAAFDGRCFPFLP